MTRFIQFTSKYFRRKYLKLILYFMYNLMEVGLAVAGNEV